MSNLVYGTKPLKIHWEFEPLIKELNFKFNWVVLSEVVWAKDDDENAYIIQPYNVHPAKERHSVEEMGYAIGNENGIPVGAILIDSDMEPQRFVFVSTECLQPWKRRYADNYVKSTTLRKLVSSIQKRREDEQVPFSATSKGFLDMSKITSESNVKENLKNIEGGDNDHWQKENGTSLNSEQGHILLDAFFNPKKTILDAENLKYFKDKLDGRNEAIAFKVRQKDNQEKLLASNFWIIGKDRITDFHYIGKGNPTTKEFTLKAYEEVEDYPESDKLIPTLLNINTLRDELVESYLIDKCHAPYTLGEQTRYLQDLEVVSLYTNPKSMASYAWKQQWILKFDV
jgi:hypothetical protein